MQNTTHHNHKRLSRFDDIRFIGSLNGRYTLSGRRDAKSGVQVFACRVQSISPRMAVLTAPVSGGHGEWVTAHFQELGIIRAQITRHLDHGFAMDIEANNDERAKLGAKIDWVKKKTHFSIPDLRDHKRLMPRDPQSSIILPNGTRMACFIIDMSQSGVAVSADISPDIGLPLAVGSVIGRVVRHLEVGFAVKFLTPQSGDTLEKALTTGM